MLREYFLKLQEKTIVVLHNGNAKEKYVEDYTAILATGLGKVLVEHAEMNAKLGINLCG
jgi:uncharacterized circularly permuted ATP-grasp superfamily protein